MAGSAHDAHARFRFSVIGSLLSSPPGPGELQAALEALAARTWVHPVSGEPTTYAFSTVERWYYTARDSPNPIDALRRASRKDLGTRPSISAGFDTRLRAQYRAHPSWSYQLHYDNLKAASPADPTLGRLPSCSTVRRYMKANALFPSKRLRHQDRPGFQRAQARLEQREVRSFEVDHVGALWHLDFHTARHISVLNPAGQWQKPVLLAVLDDHSRLCCHAQFFWTETTDDLVHGFVQALLKRGLPRELLTDNGSAMIAEEFTEGLQGLSIIHQTTLVYSPYQNGKQEHLWAVIEGRLLAMLEGVQGLTLERLNLCLQAWVEQEYHQRVHSEIGTTPLDRYLHAPEVLRPSPDAAALKAAFRRTVVRTLRRSDATFSLEGIRFEVPTRYRHLPRLTIRYARFDLGHVHLVDERTHQTLARLFPLDRSKNSSGLRRALENPAAPAPTVTNGELPPLLAQLLADYSATGLPPAFLPKPDPQPPTQEENA